MRYGHFNDQKKEYVIEQPDTPYPWINYLGTESYFCLLSNTGGGYSFFRDASKRRITRYRYNNVPTDAGGKYFYIYENNDFWSPTWAPVKNKLDFYECRHGMGYSIIRGSKDNLHCKITYFVPPDANCEIHAVKLSNPGNSTRNIKLFSFIEFCLWDALDDMTNFQRNYNTGEVEVKDSTIYHKTEYRERRNHFAFYTVNHKLDGFDTDREKFLGLYNGFHEPLAVKEGKARNSIASGWAPIASHCLSLTLKAGEEKELIFQLGYIENGNSEKWEKPGIINKEKAYKLIEKYNSIKKVEKAKRQLRDYWQDLFSHFRINSPEQKVNRMINTWNQYQCMTTYNLARSASYFESGISRGIGFRDSNQDLLGVVHMIPEYTKKRILELAAIQFADGSTYHQYQPLTKKGNNNIGSGFNDDPLWLLFSTVAYIKETGDYSILQERIEFVDKENAALFKHLLASYRHVTNNLGPHNLPLMGHADWNDCLNLCCFSDNPDESFQTTRNRKNSRAESILIAGMFITIIPDFIKLCKKLGESQLADEAENHLNEMKKAVNKYGRDEEWFLRAYDYYGNKIGSKENKYGQIYIEPQGFCIMGGLGLDDGFAEKSLNSVYKHLNTEYGLTLLAPPYKEYRLELGEITSYPPGYKENGGIFCHNNPWIIIAETIIGNGDRAFNYYKKIAPAYLEEISDLHRTEPYVYSQMIAGTEARNPGEAKNSWLTGTASWNYIAFTQWILGIRPEFDGLYIDPCIPSSWPGFTVTRKFRGDIYNISVKNPRKVNKGIGTIKMDGKKLNNRIIKPQLDGQTHNIEVIMG